MRLRGNKAKQRLGLARKIVWMKQIYDECSHAPQKEHNASDAHLGAIDARVR